MFQKSFESTGSRGGTPCFPRGQPIGIMTADGISGGSPNHAVALLAEGAVERRERGAEADGATGEQDVLRARIERLELLLIAPLPARDEEQDRRFVEMIGEVQRRLHVAPQMSRESLALGALEGLADIALEDRPVALGDPAPLLELVDRDEDPRLSIAAGGREGARLADLADQRAGDGVGPKPPNRPGGADALEQRDVLAEGRQVERGRAVRRRRLRPSDSSRGAP